jgi:hypothetical protein
MRGIEQVMDAERNERTDLANTWMGVTVPVLGGVLTIFQTVSSLFCNCFDNVVDDICNVQARELSKTLS